MITFKDEQIFSPDEAGQVYRLMRQVNELDIIIARLTEMSQRAASIDAGCFYFVVGWTNYKLPPPPIQRDQPFMLLDFEKIEEYNRARLQHTKDELAYEASPGMMLRLNEAIIKCVKEQRAACIELLNKKGVRVK